MDARLELPGEVQDLLGGGATAVRDGQRVPGGQPDTFVAVALGEPRLLDQPGSARLDQAIRLRPGRSALRDQVGRDDRVGEERAGAPGVVVVGIEHHRLAPAQGEHRLAHVMRGGTLTCRDAECSGELGVLHGRTEVPQPELEGRGEHHEALGIALEPAGAVAEAAVGGCPRADAAQLPVPGAHPGHGLADLLPVGADVLDRSGAGGPGDAGESLDPDPAALHGGGDDVVPRLARPDLHERSPAGVGFVVQAPVAYDDHPAGEALVGDDQVAAPTDDQDGDARGVR